MPIQDSVPVTTLERTVETDFTNFQDMANRSIAELAASLIRTIEVDLGTVAPTTTVRSHVASGIQIDAAGGLINIRSGFLIQNVTPSPPDVPTPDTFDSNYRFGLHLADSTIADPWDGTAAFWLLQGRVERVTTLSEVRDIFNAVTQTFAPSALPLDKRYESQIEFEWKKGTATNVPLPDVGWAPVGYLYRPAVGGAILELDVNSLTIQLEDLAPRSFGDKAAIRTSYRYQSTGGIGRASSTAFCDLEAESDGIRCRFKATAAAPYSPLSLLHIPATDVAALAVAGTIGYIYLAPLPDAMPSKVDNGPAGCLIRGVVLTSRTPPDSLGYNSGNIATPAPLANYTIGAGTAVHVGIVRISAANLIEFVDVSATGHGRMDAREFNNNNFTMNQGNTFQAGVHNLAVLGPGGTEDVPYGVQLECFLEHSSLDPTAVAKALETTFGMGAGGTADLTTTPTLWPRMMLDTDTLQSKEFALYPHDSDLTMTVTFVPRTVALANSGGGAADGANTVERAGYHGFQF